MELSSGRTAVGASRADRARSGRTLRAALTGTDVQLLSALHESGVQRLLPSARAHRIGPLLWQRLAALEAAGAALPEGSSHVLADLELDVRAGALRRLRSLADLKRLAEVLDGAGIPFLLVKGPAVAEGLYRRPELRSYSDIDVVVRREDFTDALQRLDFAGCPVLDRNWTLIREAMAGEVHVRMPLGSLVDLHWTILFHRSLRDGFALRVDEWFDRPDVVTTPVGRLPTTGPADTVVHLCLHAMSDGGHRLSWMYDLHLRVDRGVDWAQVVEVAERWRLGLVVAGMLARCRAMLGTDVPPGVLRALSPSWSWRLLTTAADRLSPVDRAGTGGSLSRMMARATRADARSSLRRLGQQVALAPLHPDRWEYTTEARTPASLNLVDDAGDSDCARRDYMQDVTGRSGVTA